MSKFTGCPIQIMIHAKPGAETDQDYTENLKQIVA